MTTEELTEHERGSLERLARDYNAPPETVIGHYLRIKTESSSALASNGFPLVLTERELLERGFTMQNSYKAI